MKVRLILLMICFIAGGSQAQNGGPGHMNLGGPYNDIFIVSGNGMTPGLPVSSLASQSASTQNAVYLGGASGVAIQNANINANSDTSINNTDNQSVQESQVSSEIALNGNTSSESGDNATSLINTTDNQTITEPADFSGSLTLNMTDSSGNFTGLLNMTLTQYHSMVFGPATMTIGNDTINLSALGFASTDLIDMFLTWPDGESLFELILKQDSGQISGSYQGIGSNTSQNGTVLGEIMI